MTTSGSVDGSDPGLKEGSLLTLDLLEGDQDDCVEGDDTGPAPGAVEILGDAGGEIDGSDVGPDEGFLLKLDFVQRLPKRAGVEWTRLSLGQSDGLPPGGSEELWLGASV